MKKQHILIATFALLVSCVPQRKLTESTRPEYSKAAAASSTPKDSTDADGWGVWPRNRTRDMPRPRASEESPASSLPTPASASVPSAPSTAPAPAPVASTLITPEQAATLQQKVAELKIAVDTVSSRLQGAVVRTLQPIRHKAPKSFDFKPTNIKPLDTIYVDTMGVKLAMWLSPKGVKFRVGTGLVQQAVAANGDQEVEVKPGIGAFGSWALNTVAAFGILFIVYSGVHGYFQSKNQKIIA
jgi:hypothetical protein